MTKFEESIKNITLNSLEAFSWIVCQAYGFNSENYKEVLKIIKIIRKI